MSLINKMLIDLETRQDSGNNPRPVFDDLRPSLGMGAQQRSPRLLVIALAFVASSATAWFIWSHREPAPAPPPVAPIAQTAAVEPAKIPAAPAVADVPAPAVAAKIESLPAVAPPTAVAAAVPAPKIETPAAVPLEAAPVAAPTAPKAKSESQPRPKRAAPRVAAPMPASEAVVIDKKAHVLTTEEQTEQIYRDGVVALKKDKRVEAEQAMRTALEKLPTHIKARELLAGLYIDARRWNEATALLTEGIAAVPQHYAFAQLAARAYVEQGQNDKALALLQTAHARAAGDADFLGFEATLMQRAGHHADAVGGYRAALALRPYEPRLWVGLGISYEAQQQWREAEDAYVHARDLGNSAPTLARYASERLLIVKGKQ